MKLHETGANFRLGFDNKARLLRVYTYQTPIPGFKGTWKEVTNFNNPEDWNESEYSRRISGENLRQTIDWFWIDLELESIVTQAALLT